MSNISQLRQVEAETSLNNVLYVLEEKKVTNARMGKTCYYLQGCDYINAIHCRIVCKVFLFKLALK